MGWWMQVRGLRLALEDGCFVVFLVAVIGMAGWLALDIVAYAVRRLRRRSRRIHW